MNTKKKESYAQPELVTHGLLRDITAGNSGQSNNDGNRRLFGLSHKKD